MEVNRLQTIEPMPSRSCRKGREADPPFDFAQGRLCEDDRKKSNGNGFEPKGQKEER
jgi:hypothetical protein